MACGLSTQRACGLCLDGLRAVTGWLACGLYLDGLRAVTGRPAGCAFFSAASIYIYTCISIHVINGSILYIYIYICVWHGWCMLPLLRYVRWHRLHEAGVAPTNVAQNGGTPSQNLLSHRGGKNLKKGAEKGEAAADQASVRARAHQQSVRAQGRQEAALRRPREPIDRGNGDRWSLGPMAVKTGYGREKNTAVKFTAYGRENEMCLRWWKGQPQKALKRPHWTLVV